MKKFKTVSAVQAQMKQSIIMAVETRIREVATRVVKQYIQKNVYEAYIPQGESAYDRTFELLNSVTVGNLVVGSKHVSFEIYMDTNVMTPQIRNGVFGYGGWNAHADVNSIDVSEYIPQWIEEGTEGSLHDREGAHYMEDAYYDLGYGDLAHALADSLRSQGWKVISV
ncbi:hypothetical protein P4639_22600 [Priestia megaterium]|uniref:hypothetical protein n=1 Tax=Priestia megaterium TaxID=1404 RepID=UPI002E1FB1D7|nr:hypothetical protein [Priestia megaterium]